jgi:Holliday junction resolvasome RuvABC endonuclease subunit
VAQGSEVILGLDLATKCGFAVLRGRKRVESGRWSLASARKGWHRGERWTKLHDELIDLVVEHEPVVIAFERVRRHVGTSAAHVYGGLLAQLEILDYRFQQDPISWGEIAFVPVEVSAWKKATVGKGNATKAEVAAWSRRRFRYTAKTEDESDALAIAEAVRRIRTEAA